MADQQRVYEGRPGLAAWGEDLGEVDPRVFRAVRAGVKANVMPATPKGIPFAGLLESTKSLPALPHFLGDLLTGGRYGLSEKAPEFALEASGKYDELINKYLAEEGLDESGRLPILEKYGLAAGEMLGQLPVPGKMLERMTKNLPKAFKPAGWLAEYFGPTVDPKAVNYAIGTGVGGTLRTATGEEEPEKFAKGGLGRKPIVRTTAEGVVETAPPTATEIRKTPGGNWLPGSVERIVDDLRSSFVTMGDRPADRVLKLEEYARENPWVVDTPAFQRDLARQLANAPVDKWLETKLTNYIKNDMATERDPVRKGIEQRVAKADEVYARGKERIAKSQQKVAEAKARGQNTAAVEDRLAQEMADLEQKYGLDKLAAGAIARDGNNYRVGARAERQFSNSPALASTPESAAWEDMTDYAVDVGEAVYVRNRPFLPKEYAEELSRIPYDAKVYELRNFSGLNNTMSHIRDELYNSIREGTDLPPELRLKADDLQKMNMDAVVAHVGKVDAWRERNRAAADLLKSRNAATVTFKEYPGTGLEWKELKMPEPDPKSKMDLGFEREKVLQEALDYEGRVMGHCVGSYCPQVASGKRQVFSLRDAKGEPHVTIEVKPSMTASEFYHSENVPESLLNKLSAAEASGVPFNWEQIVIESPEYNALPKEILQIKGKGNLKPADKYIPFVQDFVRSQKWGKVKDLYNANMDRLDPGGPQATALRSRNVEPPRYVTKEQKKALDDWIDSGKWLKSGVMPEGFADGGAVEKEEYDEREIEAIVAPLRQRLEPFLGEIRKVPRKLKQTVADITEIGPIIKRSNEIPLKYFDISGEAGGEADAMRHLLFQAQLARKYGENPAKIISMLHEYSTLGQPTSQREMDFYNDALGREIAAQARSDEDLVRLAEKYVKSGRAKVLPEEQRSGY